MPLWPTPPKGRRLLARWIYVFIFGGWKLAATATNVSSVMHIPMKTLYMVEPICGVLIVLARILKYANLLAEKKGESK